MKNLKKLAFKLSGILPALAFLVGVVSLNSACLLTYHQPEVSSDLDEYRR
jgi:cyclic lactone autoinducer peptide